MLKSSSKRLTKGLCDLGLSLEDPTNLIVAELTEHGIVGQI